MFARISRSGGGWWALAAAVVVIAGCKKKPEEAAAEAPPPTGHQTTEDRQKADLQAFFDGMLVPAPEKAQRGLMDPPWPSGEKQSFAEWNLQNTRRYGVSTREQLAEVMRVPVDKLTRNQARVLGAIYDYPTLVVYWRRALVEDPNDAEAAIGIATALQDLESPKAALAAISKSSGEKVTPGTDFSGGGGRLESIRCSLLLDEGLVKEAKQACELALKVDGVYGQRTMAKAFAAVGEHEAAIAQAERALQTWRRNNAMSWLTLGIVQQAAGDEEAARRTWLVAQQRWPKDPFLAKALSGPKLTISQWELEEQAMLFKPVTARSLASCGQFYAEAGVQDRADACYQASAKLIAGPAAAQQFVFEGMKGKPLEVLERAKAAATANPHPDLLSSVAWLQVHSEQYDDARKWAGQALDKDPENEKALSLMWQACSGLKDYLCTIEYRRQLGLPTHFNQDQYRDAKKAFDEQNRVERTGLAVVEPASAAKPAAIASITIVPLGKGVPPEIADLAPMMAKALPSLRIDVAKPQPVPGMDETKIWAVKGADVLKALTAEPGKIYVIEQDLRVDTGFSFALHDVEHGTALVSLSRFRSYGGAPMEPGTALEGGALVAAQERVRGQLFASIATLLGLKPSCSVDTCALRNRKTVAAFDLEPLKLCPEHQKQLEQALKH